MTQSKQVSFIQRPANQDDHNKQSDDEEEDIEDPSVRQSMPPAIQLEKEIPEEDQESDSSESSEEEDIIDNILNNKKGE